MASAARPGLGNLPRELFDGILDYLDDLPVSFGLIDTQPSLRRLTAPIPGTALQSLSLVSKGIRQATLPLLFRHSRLIVRRRDETAWTPTINQENRPIPAASEQISRLATFCNYNALNNVIHSFTLGISGECRWQHLNELDENVLEEQLDWDIDTSRQFRSFLTQISHSMRRLTLVATPSCIGMLLSIQLDPHIDIALHMPYHVLVLQRKPDVPEARRTFPTGEMNSLESIMDLCEWTSFFLNEGSFLRYHADQVMGWQRKLLSVRGSSGISSSACSMIRCLTYIALVAPSRHIEDWLASLGTLTNLEELRFQLQPFNEIAQDPQQRNMASIYELELNRSETYQVVVQYLVRQSIQRHASASEPILKHLRVIECMDCKDMAASFSWARATEGIEAFGWRSDPDNKNRVIKD